MSKGWESKNVEEQQAEANVSRRYVPEVDHKAKAADDQRKRRIQALEMQRERVLSERTSSPHRRSALEQALVALELELQQLGWTVKL